MTFHALKERTPIKHAVSAYFLLALLGAPFVAFYWAREPVVITGRMRPMFVSKEDEVALGETSLNELPLHKALPSSDNRVKAVVEVSLRIADAVEDILDELEKDKLPKGKGSEQRRAAPQEAEEQSMTLGEAAAKANSASSLPAAVSSAAFSNVVRLRSKLAGNAMAALVEEAENQAAPSDSAKEGEAPSEDPAAPATPSHYRTPKSRIMRKIYKFLGLERQRRWNWRVIVIEDNSVINALCAPGGIIVVYTGLLAFIDAATIEGRLKDRESALATCLAHEISHAVARHGAEKIADTPWLMLMKALGNSSPLLPILFELFYARPNSREMETEADRIGMHLMSRACYDSRNAAAFYGALHTGSNGLASYVSTHPADEARAEQAAALSAVLSLKQRAYCGHAAKAMAADGQASAAGASGNEEADGVIVRDSRVERWLTGLADEARKQAEREVAAQLLR